MSDAYEEVLVEDAAAWRAWLAEHHATSPGAWLVTWKAGSRRPHLRWEDITDEALCWGWIDSRPRRIDAERSARLLTPRRAASRWSARNRARVEVLRAAGRMQPAGLAAVELAVARGTWDALDEVEALTEPDDLRAALDATEGARGHWDGFPRSARRAILEWITAARTDATRAARVAQAARDAAVGVRANQWRQPRRPAAG